MEFIIDKSLCYFIGGCIRLIMMVYVKKDNDLTKDTITAMQ